MITIRCAFAPTATTQLYQTLQVQTATTVRQAIALLPWAECEAVLEDTELQQFALGIFAQKVTWDTLVKDGDRIEIYRPLTLDPITRRSRKRKLVKKLQSPKP